MVTVQCWTGAETKALRHAMRLSIRAFAAHLGIDARTVNKWEARRGTITLRPDTQALMDTALERAPEEVKTRFTQTVDSAKQEQCGNAAQFVAPAHDLHTEPTPSAGSLAPPPGNDGTDSLSTEFARHPLAHAATNSTATTDPSPDQELAKLASGNERTAFLVTSSGLQLAIWQDLSLRGGDEHEALELARRVAASDVSTETLSRLEDIVDELAIKYQNTPPQELLGSVRRHIAYVMRLLDARKTLDEHRRLLIIGGWLSLIAATLYIDLRQRAAANSWLATAASLAKHTGQSEMHAWRFETEAWQVLIDGDYHHAVELSQAAQRLAPRGSSAAIQAMAQEGRAWARLGKAKETYDALKRVEGYVSRMARPETPEHHYRYDPDKAEAYVATTLAWLGDVASEHHARHVVATLTHEAEAGRWPRRLASANIDLALALLLTDRLDEAYAVAQESMLSGRLVASNHWRALEVVRTIDARGLPEAVDLRETYELMRRRSDSAGQSTQ